MTNVRRRSLSSRMTLSAVALVAALIGSSSLARADWPIVNAYGVSPNVTFTLITLQNGWVGGPFGTRDPAVGKANGIVYFRGAMATAGTSPLAFTLPPAFRPIKEVFVSVDMCNETYGRLQIDPSGTVTVEAPTFSNAACFTSLDGVFFAP